METGNAILLTFDLLINVQAIRSELLGTHLLTHVLIIKHGWTS